MRRGAMPPTPSRPSMGSWHILPGLRDSPRRRSGLTDPISRPSGRGAAAHAMDISAPMSGGCVHIWLNCGRQAFRPHLCPRTFPPSDPSIDGRRSTAWSMWILPGRSSARSGRNRCPGPSMRIRSSCSSRRLIHRAPRGRVTEPCSSCCMRAGLASPRLPA